ncbi:MAG: hypothetical protein QXL94_08635 [Candidatus Parvarchaeum sp.]
MVDIDVVKKWARQNYPHLIDNEDAIVKLYRVKVLNEQIVEKTQYKYRYRTINQLTENAPAMIAVTKITKKKSITREVCKVCGKKTCDQHSERIMKYGGVYLVTDSTGEMDVLVFDTKETVDLMDNAENFLIMGHLQKSNFGNTFFQRDVKPLSKEEVSLWYDLVDYAEVNNNAGKIPIASYEAFKNSIARKDLLGSLENYFVAERNDKEIIVNMQ